MNRRIATARPRTPGERPPERLRGDLSVMVAKGYGTGYFDWVATAEFDTSAVTFWDPPAEYQALAFADLDGDKDVDIVATYWYPDHWQAMTAKIGGSGCSTRLGAFVTRS